MKAKVELTAEAVGKAIEEKRPGSMTQLAHLLGYKGSVSGTLTRKLRQLIPGIDALLKADTIQAATHVTTEAPRAKPRGKAGKPVLKNKGKAGKSVGKTGKWHRHPANPFREGSAYGQAFDILAAHRDGLSRSRLVELLARSAGKSQKLAAFDVQVLCSARALRPEEEGLNPFESPRNRSARFGYWVAREGDVVRLVLPDAQPDSKPASKAAAAAKEKP